jgi:hypothetical protein
VLENRVRRKIFGCKRKWREAGKCCITWSFITFTLHQIYQVDQVKEVMGHTARMEGMKNINSSWKI